ncbi:hypothetical protein CC117_20885 [Parafrankia colletiae]|uniref:Trypsin-co-occurring domain-containing protein n=2 Tax=Parafrankia colletiae TaxID=573497 RepID=A0A1S1QN29_9ACTN|nr:hypothetical protein CC117_20885 [Parafrankia colletiae]
MDADPHYLEDGRRRATPAGVDVTLAEFSETPVWTTASIRRSAVNRPVTSGDVMWRRKRVPAERLSLANSVEALRREILQAQADAAASGAPFYFPIKDVTIELQVGVTASVDSAASIRFWLIGLGAGGRYAQEEIQKITISLGSPVDAAGNPLPTKISAETHPPLKPRPEAPALQLP